jgi:protein-disulfide isomerase
VDERMCKGAKTAQITIVEFSDFECPYCGAARPVLADFIKRHSDRVRLCYATYPIPVHPNGMTSAQAALYARDQGKFWELHDLLFENQFELSKPTMRRLAESLGLKGAELDKVWSEGRYVDQATQMRELGKASGVESTPTLFINGRPMQIGFSEDLLVHAVDDELEWMAGNNAWVQD